MKLKVKYECSKCGLKGHKLWRQYNTFTNHIELLCLLCAEKDQKKQLDLGRLPEDEKDSSWHRPCDQIGWLVPAVPVDGENTYWGYTSVPNGELRWWHLLPTCPDKDREIAWLRAWSHAWHYDLLHYQHEELVRMGLVKEDK